MKTWVLIGCALWASVAIAQPVTGPQKLAVVMLNSLDTTLADTVTWATPHVDGNDANYQRWSYGAASAPFEFFGPFTMPIKTAGRCVRQDEARQYGWPFVVAQIGATQAASYQIRAYRAVTTCTNALQSTPCEIMLGAFGALGHEIGHCFGLGHAADSFDVMNVGGGPGLTFGPSSKLTLGWLDQIGQPLTQLITSAGRYVIEAYDTQTRGVKALRVRISCGLFGCSYYDVDVRKTGIVTARVNTTYRATIAPGSAWVSPEGIQIATVAASSTGATLDVAYGAPAHTGTTVPVVFPTWLGEYWTIPSTGTPTVPTTPVDLTRQDAALNFSWGAGGPGAPIGADNFLVRWTTTADLPAGTYTFSTTTDDGVRLFVDGAKLIDKWVGQSPTTYSVVTLLTAGTHLIRMEYFERGGGAVAKLSAVVTPSGSTANLCTSAPLLPLVSVTATGHTVTWTGSLMVTDERGCVAQVTQ